MVTFEELLARDFDWGLQEADRYFNGKGLVRKTLQSLAGRLEGLDVEFAVVGAVAMFYHGYRRFTEDADILVRPADLAVIDNHLLGSGYVRPEGWSRGIRDTETGVAIHIMVSGTQLDCGDLRYFAIPDPLSSSTLIDGYNVLSLEKMLELKLACGVASHRRRHHGDAQELIRYSGIPLNFAERLAPAFREAFAVYWHYAQIAKLDDY